MHRKNQRSGKTCKEKVSHLKISPMIVRITPSHRKKSIKISSPGSFCTVPKNSHVRNHPHVPKKYRHGSVGGDCKHIPFQWASELRPDCIGVRKGEKPPSEPYTTNMEQWENTCTKNRKNGHCFDARLIDVRHFCFNRHKTAEMSVPA